MSDRRVLQIIETELAKAVTFIDLEDESRALGTLKKVKGAIDRLDQP